MSPVFTSFRLFRLASSAALALAALACPCLPSAHAAETIATPLAIGLTHAQAAPYDFTGRILTLDLSAFGSGTLLRRHTVQTAGHVVFDPTLGFTTNATFTRALYEDFQLSQDQVVAAAALSGYQAAVISTGNNDNLTTFAQDMGYVLLHDPPVDENWGNYVTDPTLLATSPTFVIGYPGETFDGVTLAYVVPPHPYVALGTSLDAGSYENGSYLAEEGMSGGPVYVVPDGVHQYVAAETVSGGQGASASGTAVVTESTVRAIDKSAAKFLQAAEYTSGLISKVKIVGPKTVSRGQTYTYTTNVIFAVPSISGATETTDRYTELKLKSSTPGTTTEPLVTVAKTSNTTFSVTFHTGVRSGTTTTLQVYYTGTATPLGKSSLIVKVQ